MPTDPAPVRKKQRSVWEVWQGRTLVCSAKMGLTELQARNKVENERRIGYFMEARPAPPESDDCEGCGLPTYGEGRFTSDDVWLCGPCFDAVPPTFEEELHAD